MEAWRWDVNYQDQYYPRPWNGGTYAIFPAFGIFPVKHNIVKIWPTEPAHLSIPGSLFISLATLNCQNAKTYTI